MAVQIRISLTCLPNYGIKINDIIKLTSLILVDRSALLVN